MGELPLTEDGPPAGPVGDAPPGTPGTGAPPGAPGTGAPPGAPGTHVPWLASPRHLRWLVPVGLAALVLLVVALVVSVHESDDMRSMATIQTAGFVTPADSTAVRFSLPVLQAPASARADNPRTVSMASLHGKPVVLNMWSSSCSICKQETPAVESIAHRAGDAVDFVGVDTADLRGTALRFLQRYHVTYLQLSDPDEVVGSGYGIPGLPVTVFVSANGKVVGEYLGALDPRTLTHYLESLFGVRVPAS